MNRLFVKAYSTVFFSAPIIGAGCGAYANIVHSPVKEKYTDTLIDIGIDMIQGTAIGAIVGVASPIMVPAVIIGSTAYYYKTASRDKK